MLVETVLVDLFSLTHLTKPKLIDMGIARNKFSTFSLAGEKKREERAEVVLRVNSH